MGCWTGYVVREASGRVLSSFEKWGKYAVRGKGELDALVAHVRESARPVEWDAALCRGLYVDLAALEVRFYGCVLDLREPHARSIGVAIARLREALGSAYRVSYAWEGPHELARLAGDTCAPDRALDDGRDAVERLHVVSRGVEGLRWDPVSRTLHYPMFAFTHSSAWVTIIAEDGRLHDVGLDAYPAVPCVLASGPEVLARLEAECPAPLSLVPPDEHAIFDWRERRVSIWSVHPCVARAGWEGWSFERMVTDTDEHLARTGRRLDDAGVPVAAATGDLRLITYVPCDEG